MAIKGMRQDRTGHIGSDTWKNDKQNEQRGSHEKGEQAAAAAVGDVAGQEVAPDETPVAGAPKAKPGKGAG